MRETERRPAPAPGGLAAAAGPPGSFAAPAFVTEFLCAYARARRPRPRRLVDLWAPAGWMLPPLVEALHPERAVGFLGDGRAGDLARSRDPAGRIEWRTAGPAGAATLGRVDLVLGCPPWRWRPERIPIETAQGPVVLTEDPANVALLEACARLAPGGIGLFIVGPGFVMRPGPGTAVANMSRFGLALRFLLELPRGAFAPDSGSGRLVIGIEPNPDAVPFAGRLTPDADRTAALVRDLTALGRDG